MRLRLRALLLAALGGLLLAEPTRAEGLRLGLPVDCTLGETCHIQNHVDRDPGPGARDHACGPLSYDGHDGTDFALPTLAEMARGVAVLAAAPGVVAGVRDGVADRAWRAGDDLGGRECGNGVLLRHDGGWETQYCHLRQGSVRVAEGARVEAGAVLGLIGLSGRTEFPHLHLSVRRDGAAVDPFAPEAGPCGDAAGGTLWRDPPAYRAGGLLSAGFAAEVPTYDAVRAGTAARAALPRDAGALVLFAHGFGGRAGDDLTLRVTGPGGALWSERVVLERDQAQFFRAAGRRLTGAGWPAGRYAGEIEWRRGGETLARGRTALVIR